MDLGELLQSIDILEYISQFTEFKQKNGEYWALSPLKEEHTPSFSVRQETQTFYDFSSGIGGNLFTFVKSYFRCSNKDAIERLKEYAGITADLRPSGRIPAADVARKYKRHRSITQNEKNCEFGKQNCYVTTNDIMTHYEKDDSKLAVWREEGISQESLDKFQVRYDKFSNRIVYPIYSPNGKLVNVGGRTLDQDWKEKGLRKYTYFYKWGDLDTIYGLFENEEEVKSNNEIILFEGAKSVLLADTYGVKNTGAILTSHLNTHQLKLLINLKATVVFALDNDVNIYADRNIKQLKQFVNVQFIKDLEHLLGEKDSPIDKGKDVFLKLYEGRVSYH